LDGVTLKTGDIIRDDDVASSRRGRIQQNEEAANISETRDSQDWNHTREEKGTFVVIRWPSAEKKKKKKKKERHK